MCAMFRVQYDRRMYRLSIMKVYENDYCTRYQIRGKNKSLVIQTNEPLFRNKGLKYRRPDWKLVDGQLQTPGFFDALIKGIEQYRRDEINRQNGK